jgi:bifunctional ADP-heptose synthase (sugar kinase/adenylyltransferase)
MDFAADQIQIPAHIRQIADVSGAGDTVISIAACSLAAGGSAKQIAELANLGGGLVCESLGVVPIDVELLKREAAKI